MAQELKIPSVGESITEATVGTWLKQDGDYVQKNEAVLEVETDKANVEIVSEYAGQLKIKVEEGETVEIGAVVAEIDTSVEAPAGEASAPQEPTTSQGEPTKSSTEATPSENTQAAGTMSPAAQRVAGEAGLQASQIQGTGKGGRISKQDAVKAATQPKAQPQDEPAVKSYTPPPRYTGEQIQERLKMTRLRKKIAERLVASQHNTATLTTFNDVDMTAILDLRAKYKEDFKEKYGVSLGFMGFFTKACCEALQAIPEVNAFIDGDEVVYNRFVNMGVAVGTPKGLIVPVVKNAHMMTLAEIELQIRDFALRGRDGKITPDDLTGGTFTVSNGGVYGSLMSTPILNPPQTGILGMHRIEKRAVVVNDKIEIRPMMYLALSYDHRIIDGAEAVTFLVKVKEAIEDPNRLLIQV